jgi:hypothetical protein
MKEENERAGAARLGGNAARVAGARAGAQVTNSEVSLLRNLTLSLLSVKL